VQVVEPWHMTNVPVGEGLTPFVQGPANVQLPTTTPLLMFPAVGDVPVNVPVKPLVKLVRVSTLPAATPFTAPEVMPKLMLPVAWPFD